MKKTINIILTFCMIFTLIGFVSNSVIKAEENTEIERIDLTLDEEKFYYYFNVAFKEGQLDAILDETLDVKDKTKYYIDKNNTYILYCYDEEVKDTYYGYYGTGDGSENIKENTTYCFTVLLYTNDDYSFGENIQVYLNDELQDPIHNYSDTSYFNRYGDYGIEFKIQIDYASIEKIVTGFEVSETEKQVVIGENYTFNATVLGTTDDKSVNWSVSGNNSQSTNITNGTLTVGADETAEQITVKASSNANPDFYQDITVYVMKEKPYIESVTIQDIELNRSTGCEFYIPVEVLGTEINKDILWNVEGANSLKTEVNEYGYFSIPIDETSKEITVTATSVADPSKSDSITFNVESATKINEVDIYLDQNLINDLLKGDGTEGEAQTAIRENISTSEHLEINTSNTWLQYEGSPGNFYGIGWGGNNISKDAQYAVNVRINSKDKYYVANDISVFRLNGEEITPFEYYFNEDSIYKTDLYVTILLNVTGEIEITVQNVEGGTASSSRASAIPGSEIKLTYQVDEKHAFKEWQVISGNVEIVDDKFILGNEPVVIKPVFIPAYKITVTYSGEGNTICKTKAIEGEEVIIDIYPNNGYMVKEIQVLSGNVTVENNTFIVGTEDVEINVVFSKILYLTITGNEDLTKGHVSYNTDFGTEGTIVQLNPTPTNGHQFIRWVVVSGGIIIENNQFTFGTEDVVIYAVFELLKGISVLSDQYGSANADMIDALEGTKVTLTKTPNQNCQFVKWEVISGNIEIENDQFIMGNEPVVIKAIFKPIIELTLTNDGNGNATSNLSQGIEGDVLVLTPVPNEGYVFKEWIIIEGDVSISNNNVTLGLKNATIKAVFEKIYTITVNKEGNGTVVADYEKAISGTIITLTSTPDDGYYLKEYQVISGGINIENNKFIVLTSDIVIKAVFEEIHICKPIIVEKVEPTCETDGKQAYYQCTCGLYYEDEKATIIINDINTWGILSKIGHVSSDWLADKDNHWKECTNQNCDYIMSEKAAHTPNIPNATEYEDKKCTVCGYIIEEALGHQHKFDGDWKSDKDNHWKECECGEAIDQKAAHTPNIPNATEYEDKKCTECGYIIEEALGHQHKFDGDWVTDKDNHWKECECGEAIDQKAAHIDNNSDSLCDICNKELPKEEEIKTGCSFFSAHLVIGLLSSISILAYIAFKRR